MQRFKLWFVENTYDEMIRKFYQDTAPKLLANPIVQKELEETGIITSETLRGLGLPEGDANLASRELTKNYGNQATANKNWQSQLMKDKKDDYLYHITLKTRLPSILKKGLRAGSSPVFSNYTNHSFGKIFLTELGGVEFWKMRIEEHEEANVEDPQGVVVLRIPRSAVKNLEEDAVGTTDSRNPSYTTTQSIPANVIQVV